ncbi:hypothetical protein GBAR_LOCUS8452 [Geodia barretti]|uniref:Uncharacterized protein n=1 Tax=Geodia barretti TaxID=519541 RepID=A0AA35W9P6_GEOBA|nr:hypothetical protein GBAR_LOCUS8452 [Geodia barretti]
MLGLQIGSDRRCDDDGVRGRGRGLELTLTCAVSRTQSAGMTWYGDAARGWSAPRTASSLASYQGGSPPSISSLRWSFSLPETNETLLTGVSVDCGVGRIFVLRRGQSHREVALLSGCHGE